MRTWAIQRMSNHSSDQTGGDGEGTPRLVKLWEQLIDFETSVESSNLQTNRSRDERRRIKRSIIGHDAPQHHPLQFHWKP